MYVYFDIMILICPLKSLSSLLWVNNRTCQFTNQIYRLFQEYIFLICCSHLHIKTPILIYQITCVSHISLTYQKLYYFSRYKSTIRSIIISNIIYISVLISKDPSSIISNPTYQITLQIACQLTYQATLVMSSDMRFDLCFDMYETKFIS